MSKEKPSKVKGKSGYKGVTYDKKRGTYYAYLEKDGKRYTKHGFATAEEAYLNGRRELEKEHLPYSIYNRVDYENLDYPTGVRPVFNPLNVTFRATYKSKGKEKKRTFKTLQEAIDQREAWVKEFGEPNNAREVVELIGKRFGRLVVTKYSHQVENALYWECQCDCGNKVVVQGGNLKSGATESCGCYQRELTSERTSIDITGQKYGKLTAIKRLDNKTSHGKTLWLCKCECGNYTEAQLTSLRGGTKIQCEACNEKYFKTENAEKMRKGLSEPKLDGIQVLRYTDKPNKNNKTGYKGVFFDKRKGRYVANIKVHGKSYVKTGFKTAEDAYYNGRLVLEDELLPDREDRKRFKEEREKDD